MNRAFALALILMFALVSCGDDTPEPAPFDAVLIDLFGTTDIDVYLAQVEQRAAELVVTCMEDAGLEFVIPPGDDPVEPLDPRSLEDAQREGFGIISDFRRRVTEVDPAAQATEDPNLVYLLTLTSAEIDRFTFTLEGEPAEPGQRQTIPGCTGRASDLAYADWLRFFRALPNFTAQGEERDTHPDWLAARSTWRACMVDRGFEYAEPDDIKSDVISRMAVAVNEVFPTGAVPLVPVGDTFEVDPIVDELLVELDAFERDAAIANVECTLPLTEQFDAVEHEVQQAFVDRNRETIDELLAADQSFNDDKNG